MGLKLLVTYLHCMSWHLTKMQCAFSSTLLKIKKGPWTASIEWQLYIIDTYPLELCSILALLVGFLYSKIIKKSQNFFMVHFANKVITLHCTVNGGKKLPLGITTGDWTFLKTFKTQQANSDEKKEGREMPVGNHSIFEF